MPKDIMPKIHYAKRHYAKKTFGKQASCQNRHHAICDNLPSKTFEKGDNMPKMIKGDNMPKMIKGDNMPKITINNKKLP